MLTSLDGQFFPRRLTAIMAVLFFFVQYPIQTCLAEQPKFGLVPKVRLAKRAPVSSSPNTNSKRPSRAELTKAIKHKIQFPDAPNDMELTNARAFKEPLVPMSSVTTQAENRDLANALKAFVLKDSREDVADLTSFLHRYPESRWRASLEMNLARLKFDTGYLSDALKYAESSWDLSKNETERGRKAVADSAVSLLILMEAKLGLVERLTKHLHETKQRSFTGSQELLVSEAKKSLWMMENHPEAAFRCGPLALSTLFFQSCTSKPLQDLKLINQAQSSEKGTNLAQVLDWSKGLKLGLQAAKRTPGAEIIVPAVAHWKIGHFATITQKQGERFRLQDPTFGSEHLHLLSKQAIESESDGYFLVREGKLPPGWREVGKEEASTVWGKGNSDNCNESKTKECQKDCPTPCCRSLGMGMAGCSVFSMQGTQNISDVPLQYAPALGPAINILVNYNYKEGNQPAIFGFPNLTPCWSLNWVSYLQDNGSQTTVNVRGGGYETYDNTAYSTPDIMSQSTLIYNSSGGGSYTRQLPDGSSENFTLQCGSGPSSYWLMTSVVDAQGNAAVINWDVVNFRIESIADANGQLTTFNYVSNSTGNSGYYLVSSIVDPTGRRASFSYDSTNSNLISILDPVGMVSKFSYTQGSSFIDQMTTPYGSTTFRQYTPLGRYIYPPTGMRVTLPDGTYTVTETWLDGLKESYFWDRQATALYPNDPGNRDYRHCRTTKWLWEYWSNHLSPVKNWDRQPLESPVFYSYPNELYQDFCGTSNKPTQIARRVSPSVKTVTIGLQWWQPAPVAGDVITLEFYDQYLWAQSETMNFPRPSYTVQPSDTTVAHVAAGLAASINKDYLLQAFGVVSATSSGAVVMISNPTINLPVYGATVSPGAAEIVSTGNGDIAWAATISGPVTPGDILHLIVWDSALPGGSETITYTVQSGDTLASIVQNFSVLANMNTDLQTLGVSTTWLSSLPPNITYYSGNSSEQVRTNVASTPKIIFHSKSSSTFLSWSVTGSATEFIQISGDLFGAVQYWSFQRNPIGHVTRSIDPIGRQFDFTYASNNIDLLTLRETQGSDSLLLGSWQYNGNHRVTSFTDASLNQTQYAYNAAEQLDAITDALSNVTAITYNLMQLITVGGTTSGGDALSVTVAGNTANYTTISGDTPTTIAAALAKKINTLGVSGISANSTGAQISIAAPTGSSFSRTTSGSVTITIAGSNTTAFPVQVQGPLSGNNDITTFGWNFTGTNRSVTNSEGDTITYLYDGLDRLTKIEYPDLTAEQTIYDRSDAVMQSDRLNRWTQRSFDKMGQLAHSIDPLGRKTTYLWCNCGSLSQLTDAAGNSTAWHHDLQGRLIQKVYADSKDVEYTYDPQLGRLESRTDALGQVTKYAYNTDNTVQTVQYANAINSTSPVIVLYDGVFPRVLSKTNGWGKQSYSYNAYNGALLLTGTPTTNDTINLLVYNSSLSGGKYNLQYTVLSSDTTLSILSTSLKNAINGNMTLSGAGISASNSGETLTVSGTGQTNVVPTANGTTTFTLSLFPGYGTNAGSQTTINTNDSSISSGYSNATYTVATANEPLSNITSALAGSINSSLSGYGISASNSGASLTVTSTSANRTTYNSSLFSSWALRIQQTGGPTENISVSIGSNGGNALASEQNNVIANSAAAYTYDVLNRVTNRSINASANSVSWTYDAIDRVTSEVNPLGTYSFSYVDDSSGSSKAINRLSSIGYPNGQTTNFYWLPGIGDRRLQQVVNLNPSSAVLSQFNYGYDAAGQITQWQQQQNSINKHYTMGYDHANQLIAAPTDSGSQYKIYISGTTSAAEIFSVTAYDASLTGTTPIGQETATFNASGGLSASAVATNLASQINSVMGSNLGIVASASGGVVTVTTSPNYTTSFTASRSGQGTIVAVQNLSGLCATATVSGTPRAGDATSVTAYDTSLMGGQVTASYTVQSGDTTRDIASELAAQINSAMTAVNVTASASDSVVTIIKSPNQGTTFSASAPGNAETITLGDAKATPNLHTQLYYFYDLAGNRKGVQGESTGSFPSGLTTTASRYEYNNINELTGVSAGGPIKFEGQTVNPIKSLSINVPKTATVGGSITIGDQLTIVTHDSGLAQPEPVSYTVQSGDSTTSIATALKNAINANTTLGSINVTATSSGAVITITSTSANATTYTALLSNGATETLALSESVAAIGTVSPSTKFAGDAELSSGPNTVSVTALSGGGTAATDSYSITVTGAASQSLTYDDNGNLTNDGTNSYSWDVENRLLQITYPGSGNNTQFTYDPLGRCVKIVETVASSVTSTKQFVWCGAQRCEERDGSGSLSNGKQFFALGQVNFASGTPTNYFYTQDHLGSTREMTKTVSGTTTIEAQYAYDPYGIATKLQGSQDADFQYAGYYMHAPSGLNLPVFRAYSSSLGRFINRDPIGEDGGINLYAYVNNAPVMATDPSGLVDWGQVQTSVNIGTAAGIGVGAGIGGAAGGALGLPAGGIGAIPGSATGAVMGGALGGAVGGFGAGASNLAGQMILEMSGGGSESKGQSDSGSQCQEKELSPKCKTQKNKCIDSCTKTLPTYSLHGAPFRRCVDQCMFENGCPSKGGDKYKSGSWSFDYKRWVKF
ncbi:MAG: LysM peptidoglycan-binding domain-containing protein [Candidatus Obscuribacterales bacterium]|nr:LysM peptidoglycan-binding domain-containing protein [Candidatus Obscuribacterales bacterium]